MSYVSYWVVHVGYMSYISCMSCFYKSFKIAWIYFKQYFLFSKKFWKNFREYIKMENPSYKNENIERNYLNKMPEKQFLKVNNSLLELEKGFIELKDRESKDREVKI